MNTADNLVDQIGRQSATVPASFADHQGNVYVRQSRYLRMRAATMALDVVLIVALAVDIYATWGRHRPAASPPAAAVPAQASGGSL